MLPSSEEHTDSPSNVLLVEGRDDECVVNSLIDRFGHVIPFSVQRKDGIRPLIDSIAAEILAPSRRSVGILVDANDDLSARWKAVKHQFMQAKVVGIPKAPSPKGTIIPNIPSGPKVGVWLMPDNNSKGELETFVRSMISSDDLLWPIIDEFVQNIPEEHREFSKKKALRAKLYVWLATREKPGLMATAIRAKYLDIEGQLVQDFVNWLVNLFSTETN